MVKSTHRRSQKKKSQLPSGGDFSEKRVNRKRAFGADFGLFPQFSEEDLESIVFLQSQLFEPRGATRLVLLLLD